MGDQDGRPLQVDEHRYRTGKLLGQGTFANVYAARNLNTRQSCVLKVIKRQVLQNADEAMRIDQEIKLGALLHHPNICATRDTFFHGGQIHIELERCHNGELFDLITREGHLNEARARTLFRQVASAVFFLHENFLIHRDLKPENIMLAEGDVVKLIDFGMCGTYSETETRDFYCGSPAYASPEMVQGVPYVGPEVDIWSMGVLLYAMVVGRLPFYNPDIHRLYRRILDHPFDPIPAEISPECADLIGGMLIKDPARRARREQILQHPWMVADLGPIDTHFVVPPCVSRPDNQIMELMEAGGVDRARLTAHLRQGVRNAESCRYHLEARRSGIVHVPEEPLSAAEAAAAFPDVFRHLNPPSPVNHAVLPQPAQITQPTPATPTTATITPSEHVVIDDPPLLHATAPSQQARCSAVAVGGERGGPGLFVPAPTTLLDAHANDSEMVVLVETHNTDTGAEAVAAALYHPGTGGTQHSAATGVLPGDPMQGVTHSEWDARESIRGRYVRLTALPPAPTLSSIGSWSSDEAGPSGSALSTPTAAGVSSANTTMTDSSEPRTVGSPFQVGVMARNCLCADLLEAVMAAVSLHGGETQRSGWELHCRNQQGGRTVAFDAEVCRVAHRKAPAAALTATGVPLCTARSAGYMYGVRLLRRGGDVELYEQAKADIVSVVRRLHTVAAW